ncbi:MAG: metal-dependent transcriptional regulator [Clostridiales Family XIII bacterium]|nr:metal-dependent transcriptional regulator [Clostridiales Family XIII bacterium]
MKIYESGENYLETILILEERTGSVRSIDIANELGYSKPSVSRAMGILKREGFIKIDEDGIITLTKQGNKTASAIYERHVFIADYLERALGVNRETATEDACRIEHIISDESFDRMKSWLARDRNNDAAEKHENT